LIDKYEISCAPSATIYCHYQSRPQPRLENALVIGVPDPSIPAVTAEIEAVAARLPGARLLYDKTATQENIMAAVPESGLLHLACHGLFRADNPMFSALKLHDGWLTAGEAMKMRLPNALVTLSACESGRSQVAGGDELLGLLRGFLGAGAAAIVVSLWLAQDVVTAGLMVNWYNIMCETGASPARALREAQLTVKKEYSHPFYWAPFIAVGRR
jgi:CHAT domain-containing protein